MQNVEWSVLLMNRVCKEFLNLVVKVIECAEQLTHFLGILRHFGLALLKSSYFLFQLGLINNLLKETEDIGIALRFFSNSSFWKLNWTLVLWMQGRLRLLFWRGHKLVAEIADAQAVVKSRTKIRFMAAPVIRQLTCIEFIFFTSVFLLNNRRFIWHFAEFDVKIKAKDMCALFLTRQNVNRFYRW